MKSEQLKSLPLFEGIADEVVEECAPNFQETEMLAGTVLAREGDFAYKFFVVLEGEVEVQRDLQHIATLGPGDFFGEMGVIESGRRNARVLASTRCKLAWMMIWDFDNMTKSHPEIAARIQAAVEGRSGPAPAD